jgi:hypothetical protein
MLNEAYAQGGCLGTGGESSEPHGSIQDACLVHHLRPILQSSNQTPPLSVALSLSWGGRGQTVLPIGQSGFALEVAQQGGGGQEGGKQGSAARDTVAAWEGDLDVVKANGYRRPLRRLG